MNSPKVSVIIPTLNAAAYLPACLRSIRAQDYPQELIEILVADGGSTDQSKEIAGAFGATIIHNLARVAESGKELAMKAALSDYILFVDSDNEISSLDFLRLAVEGLEKHPGALGVESYYPAAPGMKSFCAYLTATLHISDPITWMMSVTPRLMARDGEVEIWRFPENSLAYPLGANGFLYRRADLVSVSAMEHFEDSQVALRLAMAGKKEWLRLRNRGVHHHVVRGLGDFIRKRRRQTYHFLRQRGKQATGPSWTAMNPAVSPIIACVYCASVVGPLFHAVKGIIAKRDMRWLWHLLACPASLVGLAWGVGTFYVRPKNADSEASLQPRQNMTNPGGREATQSPNFVNPPNP